MTQQESANTLDDTWKIARKQADLLNPIPSVIGNAVQALWQNHLENQVTQLDDISKRSRESLKLFDRSDKLKAPLFQAAISLYPKKMEELKDDHSAKALLQVLQPGLFSVLLGLVFFHRRLAKISTSFQNDWEPLSKEIVLNMEVGYRAGTKLKAIGPALGTLIGGIRYMAAGTFLIKTPDAYTAYRRKNKMKFNEVDERQGWGCTIAQVAAYLLKDLAIRRELVETSLVFTREAGVYERLPDEFKHWHGFSILIDGLKYGFIDDEFQTLVTLFGLTNDQIIGFKSITDEIASSGPSFAWMLKPIEHEEAVA